MNIDSYGEVINGENTYREIADKLLNKESIIIGWTDEKYTHYDILFSIYPYKKGYLQRGLTHDDLYVSIIGLGSFGFNICNEHDGGYIAEKLNLSGDCSKLAELLNNIQKLL